MRHRLPALILLGIPIVMLPLVGSWPAAGQDIDQRIREAEARRIASIEKVRPAVTAVFGPGGGGGGSGVVVTPDGYALTNFHVVSGGKFYQCGLADGELYDAVVVGLDPVGDVAVIKLHPKVEGKPFPFAPMGDSDKVRAGDWSFAMGNPFLLATDFTPTVTFGLVSGVHRYQYPSGTILEYTDCIQIDTSINPGNSGGPLFNLAGEVIGINGRGSFEKRGRVNSGVGYAISINQIKNFLGHLRGGVAVDHATAGFTVTNDEEGEIVVSRVLDDSDARRRGVQPDDRVIYFGGRHIGSQNEFKNVLGIYPNGWRVPLVVHRRNENNEIEKREVLVRLMRLQPEVKEGEIPMDPEKPPRVPRPKPGEPPIPIKPAAPPPEGPIAKMYEAKTGFTNYYFNKLEQQRLMTAFRKHGDFSKLTSPWSFDANEERPQKRGIEAAFDDKTSRMKIGTVDFSVEPLKEANEENLREPRDSGGLLVALYHWRRLLVMGEKGFEGGFAFGGHEPFYPNGTVASRLDTEVLNTDHGGVHVKWFFSPKDQTLVGMECYIEKDRDPSEITFLDYKEVDGRKLPHRLEVRYADKEFGAYVVKGYKLAGP